MYFSPSASQTIELYLMNLYTKFEAVYVYINFHSILVHLNLELTKEGSVYLT